MENAFGSYGTTKRRLAGAIFLAKVVIDEPTPPRANLTAACADVHNVGHGDFFRSLHEPLADLPHL
jgi:hypothetical protein